MMLACPVLLFIILRFAGSLLAPPTIGQDGEEAPAGHLEPIAEEDGDEDSAESRTVETDVKGKIEESNGTTSAQIRAGSLKLAGSTDALYCLFSLVVQTPFYSRLNVLEQILLPVHFIWKF